MWNWSGVSALILKFWQKYSDNAPSADIILLAAVRRILFLFNFHAYCWDENRNLTRGCQRLCHTNAFQNVDILSQLPRVSFRAIVKIRRRSVVQNWTKRGNLSVPYSMNRIPRVATHLTTDRLLLYDQVKRNPGWFRLRPKAVFILVIWKSKLLLNLSDIVVTMIGNGI